MVRDDEKKSIFKSRTDIDNSSPNQNIQDIFTKYFKIKGIKIHWSDNVPNAYTIIVSLPIMYLVNQQKLQENKKFINDELSIYIFLSTTFIIFIFSVGFHEFISYCHRNIEVFKHFLAQFYSYKFLYVRMVNP